MKPDLQKQLYAKYPELFSTLRTIETRDGWYKLLEELCKDIQKIASKTGEEVKVTQVKEKFGSLRFYFQGGNQQITSLVIDAENQSEKICEECGKPGKLIDEGWLMVRCEDCNAKKD